MTCIESKSVASLVSPVPAGSHPLGCLTADEKSLLQKFGTLSDAQRADALSVMLGWAELDRGQRQDARSGKKIGKAARTGTLREVHARWSLLNKACVSTAILIDDFKMTHRTADAPENAAAIAQFEKRADAMAREVARLEREMERKPVSSIADLKALFDLLLEYELDDSSPRVRRFVRKLDSLAQLTAVPRDRAA